MIDEFECKSAEAVVVSDHNLLDISTHHLVQNEDDTNQLPVDVRSDVVDDLGALDALSGGL